MRRAAEPPALRGYDYLRTLGSGGFSDVYLYRQRLPRREVAVKVLLVEDLQSTSRERFVAEANVMAQLSTHPYIVAIYHADVADDERPYFVMEYCSGPSLAALYRRAPFEVPEALRTGIRLAGAVATAHAAGILHRDIKPANVLTNDFGWPALTDFGISSTIEGELLSHTTTTDGLRRNADTSSSDGASVGLSVPWSPPEMFGDDPKPDARSDLFSLTATIHTLLAGRTPFEVPGRSNGTLDIIGRIERGAITPLDRPDVPGTLTSVLQRGMAARREDRYESVVELGRALQRIELELGYSPTPLAIPNSIVEATEARAAHEGLEADPEATRARSVATIAAQPQPQPAPPAPAAPPRATPERIEAPDGVLDAAAAPAPLEETVVRSPSTVPGAPAPGSAPARESADVAEADLAEAVLAGAPSRRRPVVIGVCVLAAVLVLGAIIAAITLPHAAPAPEHAASSGSGGSGGSGGGIDVSTIPTPVAGTVTRSSDGSTVSFTWSNPKPQTGDAFEWTQSATNANPVTTTTAGATVTDATPGQQVCIQVVIVRSGQASPNPLKECTS